jgi:biotin synthase
MAERFKIQSPQYAKISHATAISLGLVRGRMYRGAVNRCVNLLLHYPEGCSANCAYCGLAKKRPGSYKEKSFIHVDWPIYPLERIVDAINDAPPYVKRTCVSMITHGKSLRDTYDMTRSLKEKTDLPISILISPTVMKTNDLQILKESGADKIGIAIDLATPELFEQYRGSGVSGPHRWAKYWAFIEEALPIFGHSHVGAHLMVGMGETEKEMVVLMEKLWNMGVVNHLFSFLAEEGSKLSARPQPSWSAYLRIQMARYLIEARLSGENLMNFDSQGRIAHFGLNGDRLKDIVYMGLPFMTAGCLGPDGQVACNRPFGNCLPDIKQWNYPYPPNDEELTLIHRKIFDCDE